MNIDNVNIERRDLEILSSHLRQEVILS